MWFWKLFILLHIFCVFSGAMPENSPKKLKTSANVPWEDDFRLPSTVHPDHYDLYVYPDLSTKTFTGSVSINVTSTEARDYFLIHTKWLNISQTKLYKVVDATNEEIPILELFEYEPNEYWVIKTNQTEPGAYRFTMDFSGSLTNGILGFYYSEYTDDSGNKKGLATTKFEPTYARRAFPCFDEPSFKSTYSVTIVRPSDGYIALSNMPVQSEKSDAPSAGLTEVTFEKSVPMVTYLVCYIVSDFTYKETILSSGMPFRVYAPASRIENTQFSMDVGASILQMYEQMFDLPFPLPKSDMAGIPDYSSGATEHWGIITFRETNIFYNENQSSAANKQRVASVVAHELAHQWFGNLVTLKWWDDLWINEGFASYVEYKGVDYVFPDWQMDAQFPVSVLQDVFIDDSKLSSHPIVQPVANNDDINAMFNSIAYDKDAQFQCKTLQVVFVKDACCSSHPIVQKVATNDQINAMFDAISYKKGSSVLRMLEDFMGESSYQAGINSFLKKFAYENAVTDDLWAELTAAWEGNHPDTEKGDVGAIMDTWTRQMGYPVVTVSRLGPDSFNVSQKRFLQDPTAQFDSSESPFAYKWDIPVSFISSANNTAQRKWLYSDTDNMVLQLDSDVTWIKVNIKQKGFYRVNYDPDMWSQLEALCISKVLDASERAGLLNDAIALADAELLDYSVALNMTRMLASDTEYVPWNAVSGQLTVIENLLSATEATQVFKSYVSSLADPLYQTLGWEDTGEHLEKLLRIDIVTVACASGNDGCLSEVAQLLKSWISDAAYPLPLGTKRQVYRWGIIREGSQENWDAMWARALVEQSATEVDNLYYGMANSQDPAILLKYIQLAQDEQNVRSQNFLNILQYISSNPAGSDLVWDWVRSNWEWLVDRYTLNDRYLGQLIPNISKYFATDQKLQEMEAFFLQYPEAGAGEMSRKEALETLKFNIHWVEANSGIILDWVNSQMQKLDISSNGSKTN